MLKNLYDYLCYLFMPKKQYCFNLSSSFCIFFCKRTENRFRLRKFNHGSICSSCICYFIRGIFLLSFILFHLKPGNVTVSGKLLVFRRQRKWVEFLIPQEVSRKRSTKPSFTLFQISWSKDTGRSRSWKIRVLATSKETQRRRWF